MEAYELEIIETVAILLFYLLLRFVLMKTVARFALKFGYQKPRIQLTKKLTNLLLFAVCLGVLLSVWGVHQSDLIFFISSLLTVLGIAFFAQWSILSNITSTLIIFFNHPAKIGDTITVMDKEYTIDGKIVDVGAFFVIIKTKEGESISIPNNVFIQKMIRRQPNDG